MTRLHTTFCDDRADACADPRVLGPGRVTGTRPDDGTGDADPIDDQTSNPDRLTAMPTREQDASPDDAEVVVTANVLGGAAPHTHVWRIDNGAPLLVSAASITKTLRGHARHRRGSDRPRRRRRCGAHQPHRLGSGAAQPRPTIELSLPDAALIDRPVDWSVSASNEDSDMLTCSVHLGDGTMATMANGTWQLVIVGAWYLEWHDRNSNGVPTRSTPPPARRTPGTTTATARRTPGMRRSTAGSPRSSATPSDPVCGSGRCSSTTATPMSTMMPMDSQVHTSVPAASTCARPTTAVVIRATSGPSATAMCASTRPPTAAESTATRRQGAMRPGTSPATTTARRPTPAWSSI